nr:MAG TPA: hypothetical protein [Caudoviricetes sp.]
MACGPATSHTLALPDTGRAKFPFSPHSCDQPHGGGD